MSDYLSNLAARSLNATEVIQPRLRSLFEPSHIASVPTVGQNIGLEGVDQVFTHSKTDFELDSTHESSKSSFNNPKSDVPFPPSSTEGTQNLKSLNELHQLPDRLTRMQDDRDRPLSPPSISTTVQPAETRLEPPPTQPMLASAASTEIPSAPSSRVPELQTSPQRELIIERIVERVTSPDEPRTPTLLRPQPASIQTTALPLTVSEPLSRIAPQQSDPEHPTLNPVVPSQTINTGHSSKITSSPKSHSYPLEPTIQRIVTERVVSPVEPLAKATPHSAPSSSPTTVPSTSATVVVQPQVTPYVEPKASTPVQVTVTPEPTIQVTIGRIEVRATPLPTPPSQRQRETLPRPALPVMSLDEYLSQRANGGGR